MMHVWLILFMLCPSSGYGLCIDGELRAASCEAGTQWLRDGMREDQELFVTGCERA
jgi:hypothetical protein